MEPPLHPSTSSPSSHHHQLPVKSAKRSHLNDSFVTSDQNTLISKWKTPTQQQIYSAALLRALPRDRASTRVRLAADKALAISAKGSTRWSRAILKRRRRLLKVRKGKAIGDRRGSRERKGKVHGVEKRVGILRRLIPGCKKASFPNLLEETTDYIAALEMQVRAMAALANILSRASGGAVPEV